MNFHGYMTLMSPEAMKLSYLETLLSWSRMCESISICYSRFPELDLPVPEGAVKPWEYDGSLEILRKFDAEVLGGKLNIIEHTWDPDEPREDGFTKQIAREAALAKCGDDNKAWVWQFDADEILRDGDELRLMQEAMDNNDEHPSKWKPFIVAGILELFGSDDQVRFNFGNWVKIRGTRNEPQIKHGLPLRLNGMAVRARNPRTGRLVALDNRDDAAGFITTIDFSRPNYNVGLTAADLSIVNGMAHIRGGHPDFQRNAYPQLAQHLATDISSGGVWMYHTSWIDIPRKWRMGWFFDNFWAVLSGKQDTFTEKAALNGKFTHTRCPAPDKLEAELKRELDRIEIQPLYNSLVKPSVFAKVAEWRKNN